MVQTYVARVVDSLTRREGKQIKARRKKIVHCNTGGGVGPLSATATMKMIMSLTLGVYC